ncbi:MAG TPA: hypothetical protein DET40_07105 [Lentisphaeria bacterium]|nr:MAG: hypothetical protein A2X45_07195 [Lentisphaerae bacterium GWF2_50_93]HCE43299.1 hypothetical protein [Lentisphaeria bacterium]
MKKIYQILAVPVLILGIAIGSVAQEKAADAIKSAQQKLQAKDFAGALKDADQAIALAGDNANERISAIFMKGQVAEAIRDFAKAKGEYAKIAADEKATLPQKITAMNKTAAVLIAEKMMDEARAEYAKIAGMPGATPVDIINAKFATAKTYENQRDYDKANGIYSEVYSDAETPKQQKIQAIRNSAAVLLKRCRYDEARAEYAKILSIPDLKINEKLDVSKNFAVTYERQGEFAKAREEYAKAAAFEGLDAKGKANVLTGVAGTYKRESDLVNMKKTMAAISELVPAPDFSLLRDYAMLAAAKGDSNEEEAALTQILSISGINNAQYADALFKRIGNLAANQKNEEAKKLASDSIANARLSEEQKFLCSLLSVGFGVAKGASIDPKSIPAKSLDAEKQARLYNDAAKVFMRARNYEIARFFGDKADAMFRDNPQYVYECKFMDKSPFGVSGWQNSEIVKDPSRRETRFEEYNRKAADLLINDVNVVRDVGRGEAKKNNAGFYMSADSRGWHVYVHCQDDQVEQVLAGLAKSGSLEMYFVPGKGECYYQWMITLPSEKTNFIEWMSPNRNYRKMDDYFKVEIAPVDDGFGVYMFFPWDLVYDKLPQEGDLWTFGLVNWSRSGGFTWGSGQVHELNKFGKVKFTGVDKYMPAVRRALVMKAFANYKMTSAAATTFWKDEVKGDRDFYEKSLLPEIEKFNELGKLVKPEMTQADADMLFEKAVPDWMEFDYLVSELRTEYLQNKFLTQ